MTKLHILDKKKWPMPLPINLIVSLLRIIPMLVWYCTNQRVQADPKNDTASELKPAAIQDMVKGYVAYKRQQYQKRALKALISSRSERAFSQSTFRQSSNTDNRSTTSSAMPRPMVGRIIDNKLIFVSICAISTAKAR